MIAMTDYGLTPQQLEVIDALTSGVTMTAAAAQVGVHRNTIANWRRNNLPFQHAYAHAQYDRAILVREKMEELADLAVDTLRSLLADPQASPSVRLKAALAVIQAVSTPPPPKKQVELEIEKLVVQSGPPKVVTLEQFGEGLLPGLSFKDVRLLHPFPRKIAALSAELVAQARELLFLGQMFFSSGYPGIMGHNFMSCHRVLLKSGLGAIVASPPQRDACDSLCGYSIEYQF